MKKTMRIVALLLALVMMTAVLAGCNNGDDNTTTAPSTTAAPSKTYTWDVTFVFHNYDVLAGEEVPDFTLTEKANAENTLTISPLTVLGEYAETGEMNAEGNPIMAWTKVDVTTMVDDDDDLNLTGELKSSSATFNEADWTVVNNEAAMEYEVVTAPTDTTKGELIVKAIAPDYKWNISFVYEAGAEGSYNFQNPGLDDWAEPYRYQSFAVTPDATEHVMPIFNFSSWIVDDTKEWYKWVVEDLDDECPYITFEVVKALDLNSRLTPGELKVTISLEAPAA